MSVYRCFVEKKKPYAVEAAGVLNDLKTALRSDKVKQVRILNRYDLENIDKDDYVNAQKTILSEPQVDDFYDEKAPEPAGDEWVFATEYLPGQFDQRADSCAQCIQLATMKQRPAVRTARVYYIQGELSEEDREEIRKTLINPVEAREASLEKPDTIIQNYPRPALPEVLHGFDALNEEELKNFINEYGLAMDLPDIEFLQKYFRDEEKRDPTITEIRVIDTYWSDHCRHTTFNTIIDDVDIQPEYIQETYKDYLELRKKLYINRPDKKITLMDLGTIGAKALKAAGKLKDLDESEEINACSVKIKVNVNGEDQDWLLMFKNETHNHPTEIEPFGGAATCLGGAIRDPLSGRSYVYQAMRITGAGDPLTPLEDTLKGKLPQRKIVTTAAHGYSSYGNQIGLSTGLVHEIYHPGYVAKRMEVGAVMAAAPAENVIRERPEPGDVVILLGGRTGRDGCGGATGSSKSHNVDSLAEDGAEVQKGNAPEERKLQRLFRNPEAAKLIKRCNDFGAGGVSVAIGELADGLHINLNKVPKKYEGLNGTELAISESQERMAVVTSKEDAEHFQKLADAENLESTVVAEVIEDRRMIMELDGTDIVNISREFLNSNGAPKYTKVEVPEEKVPEVKKDDRSFAERMNDLAGDLNICSQKGLSEMFDSTIGAGTVLMPFGGKWQLTPNQTMAAKVSVLDGDTDTVSLMSWGYDPYLSSESPYKGAVSAVIASTAKIIAAGGDMNHAWYSFQEYFGHTNNDPKRWGLPFSALLGALKAQMELGIGSIGGKDSMSGTFEHIDVPPTLISFAVSVTNTDNVVSTEWKKAGHEVYLLSPSYDENGIQNWDSVRKVLHDLQQMIHDKKVYSAWTLEYGGIAEGILKAGMGNHLGMKIDESLDTDTLFAKNYGAVMIETDGPVEGAQHIGTITSQYEIAYKETVLEGSALQKTFEAKLAPVYPYQNDEKAHKLPEITSLKKGNRHASYKVEKPHVLIPVFPGTNCEWDTAKAFERAGAETEIFVIRNLTSEDVVESADRFAAAIHHSEIIAIPGGFSGGDEPEGSAKFITSFFRNPKVKEAVTDLLDNREGLMLGICNGFQALIKLGLVPYGRITEEDENSPTLTFNTIGRHQSMIVRTRISTADSPWLQYAEPGQIYDVAVSHGEGRFIASDEVMSKLIHNGQIVSQYVDLDDQPTDSLRFNPNNSIDAVEGIISPDGRILGKMGHSERTGKGLYQNIPDFIGEEFIFKGAVDYFR